MSGLLYPYSSYIIDSRGQPIVDVNIAVLSQVGLGQYPNTSTLPGSPLAAIYYDEAGLYPLPNPFNTTTSNISYSIGGNSSILVDSIVLTNLNITAPNAGAFTVPHGLGQIPTSYNIAMTSNGIIWTDIAADATNLYLKASASNLTAIVTLYTTTGVVTVPSTISNSGLDGLGNFTFYTLPGFYTIQFYGGALSNPLNEFDIEIGNSIESFSVPGQITVGSLVANGSITSNSLITGNILANYIFGNGSELTGLYSNINVLEYLPTYFSTNGQTANVYVTGLNYTPLSTDYIIELQSTCTVTLNYLLIKGTEFIIKNLSNSSGMVTVQPNNLGTIELQSSAVLYPGQSITIVYDGINNWTIV